MAYYFSSQDLIDSVKRRANIPDSQDMVTDVEILDYANEELALNLVPLIISKHENYFLTMELVPTITDVKEYQIPYRSIGNRIREAAFTDNETPSPSYIELHQIPVDDITSSFNRINGSYGSNRFYIRDESIVLDSSDNSLDYNFIAMWFNIRPNQLVDSARVSVITGVDRTTGIVTVSSIPDNFSASSQIDFIRTKSPHRILSYDIGIVDINASAKFFQFDVDDIPQKLEVGDRICLANESDLVNIPSELHVMLAQSVSNRLLESMGDLENLSAGNKKLQKMEHNSQFLLDNRVEGSPIKARPKNGLLRGRRSRRFRR